MLCLYLTCDNFIVPPKEKELVLETQRKVPRYYELVEGLGYYNFHTDIKTWEKARETCEKEGAHLAIINSQAEAKRLSSIWIRNIFKDWRNESAYIGTWDPLQNGQFVTLFSKTIYYSNTIKLSK